MVGSSIRPLSPFMQRLLVEAELMSADSTVYVLFQVMVDTDVTYPIQTKSKDDKQRIQIFAKRCTFTNMDTAYEVHRHIRY